MFRVSGAGWRVKGEGCRVQGVGFRVQGSGFRVQGSGCRVKGSPAPAPASPPAGVSDGRRPGGGGERTARYSHATRAPAFAARPARASLRVALSITKLTCDASSSHLMY